MILSTVLIRVLLAVVTHLTVSVAWYLSLVYVVVWSGCFWLVDDTKSRVIQISRLFPSSDAITPAGGRGEEYGEATRFLTVLTQTSPRPHIPLVRTSHVTPPRCMGTWEMKS